MYSYTELLNKFNRSTIHDKTSFKLENNTYVLKADYGQPDYGYKILLHSSIIAHIPDDSTIVLYSDNWRTPTTKDRLNKILSDNKTGYTIYQVNHVWQVHKDSIPWRENEYYKFADGITFKYELNCKMGNDWEVYNFAQDNSQEINELKRKITKYVNSFYDDFTLDKIPVPSSGDCWDCSMFHSNDKTHLLSHIDENYYVPSLLVNAVKSTPQSILSNELIYSWINQDKEIFNQYVKIVGYQIKKALYKYLVDKLITNT